MGQPLPGFRDYQYVSPRPRLCQRELQDKWQEKDQNKLQDAQHAWVELVAEVLWRRYLIRFRYDLPLKFTMDTLMILASDTESDVDQP